MTELGQRCIST